MKVEYKEKITERYPGEVYQGISRCVEWRNITRVSVGIQYTGGLADMSGRKLKTHEDIIEAFVGRILVGIKCAGVVRIVTAGI